MKYELYKVLPQQWVPKNYAKRAAKFLLENRSGALFLDPGLGKTSISLAAVKILLKKKLMTKILVIAPKRVCYLVWPKEVAKWKDFHNIRVSVLHGPNKQEALDADADIYVINPEGLEWLFQVVKTKRETRTGKIQTDISIDLKRWKKLGFDALIIDELSKFKDPSRIRFRMLKMVHHTFSWRWGLTGSPAPNGLMDLFGQCYILDQGRTFGQYITHYRNEFFTASYNGYGWKLLPGAAEKIYNRVKPLALRMASADYLEMPALVENNIYVELPPAAREIYDEMEKDLLANLEGGTVTAANTAVASGKCRQIASGGIYHGHEMLDLVLGKGKPAKRETSELHNAKTEALEDLIEEIQGAPILVAYDFQHDLERLQKHFGGKVPVIGGGVGMKETTNIEKKWNAGEIPLLFAHPQAMAHGLNLQGCSQHVCWYSLTWDYELYDQFIRRILRQGNTHSRVFVHHILAEDTIDDLVMLPSLKAKRAGQNALFEALKNLQRFRK